MKKIILTIITISLFKYSNAQHKQNDSIATCSKVMQELSYYWKLDSLANNGFRYYTYDMLLKSKIDKVDRAYLFQKLGKPNYIQKTNKGVEFHYFYFDKRTMPKDFTAPNACWYINFKFNDYDKYLSSITEGDTDL